MDEDSLVIPASWRRRLHPRRGGTPGSALKLDQAAGTEFRAKAEAQAADIEEVLGNPRSDPGLVVAARRHLRGEDDPLGASVVGQIVFRHVNWQRDPFESLVDAWCADHGVPFAAAATAALSSADIPWRWIEQGKVSEAWAEPLLPGAKYGTWWGRNRVALRRMRTVLAAAEESDYELAVARLANCRDDFLVRLATAYLVPTRQDWVDEGLAEMDSRKWRAYDWLLWCSIESAEQLPTLGTLSGIAYRADLITTAVDGVGAAMAPLLAEVYDKARRAEDRKIAIEPLAILPTDEAFQALLDRADRDRVRPALMAAMKRFPVRAARLLTAAASPVAAELLAEHLVSHPELGDGPKAARVRDARVADLPKVLVDPPWERKRPARTSVVIDDLVALDDRAVVWAPGEREGAEPIVRAAKVHGARAAAAIAELMAASPLPLVPVRVPKLGDWADPALLPQVLLAGGNRALPLSATRQLLTLLALSGNTGEHIAEVRAVCDAESLAGFSWAVFERWQAAGAPGKDGWALTQLGALGGDEAARRLTPLIKAWPGESRHKNASLGLDVLAAIGTDVALMHLHGIAQKVKFKALKEQAREKIAEIAAGLGLSQAELADRLVPDFGLDPGGSLVLDYGPRRFTVGFDEQLKPYVLDEDGKPRKALPKPAAKDDAGLASAAYKRYAALKKDVRTVAAGQVLRLETAMVDRRRWTLPDFQRLLAGHPLIGHIVRRLVWLTGDGTTFRVAEDGTFADSADDTCELPSSASIRVAHPLTAALDAWGEVFADYEIAQPFPQLDRPVHTLTPAERETGRLERFEGITVPYGRLLALERRGWEHDFPADAGIVFGMSRALPGGATASIGFDPAVAIGNRDPAQEVTLSVWVHGDLDPVIASELLTELIAVTGGART